MSSSLSYHMIGDLDFSVSKPRSSFSSWKTLAKTKFLRLQSNLNEENLYRICFKNSTALVSEISKNKILNMVKSRKLGKIKKVFILLQNNLSPILVKMDKQDQNLRIKDLETLMEDFEKRVREEDNEDDSDVSESDEEEGFTFVKDENENKVSLEVEEEKKDEKDFDDELEELNEKVKTFNSIFRSVKKLLEKYEKIKNLDNEEILKTRQGSKELQKISNEVKEWNEKHKKTKPKMSNEQKKKYKDIGRAFMKISKELNETFKKKEFGEIILKSKLLNKKSRIERRIEKSKKRKNKKNFMGNNNYQNEGDVQTLAQETDRMVISRSDMEKIDFEHELAKEKYNDLLNVEAQFNEVHEMMSDMKTIVEEQDGYIQTIEDAVHSTQLNVEKGRKNIRKARKGQRMGTRGCSIQ